MDNYNKKHFEVSNDSGRLIGLIITGLVVLLITQTVTAAIIITKDGQNPPLLCPRNDLGIRFS